MYFWSSCQECTSEPASPFKDWSLGVAWWNWEREFLLVATIPLWIFKCMFIFMIVWTLAWAVWLVKKHICIVFSWVCMYVLWEHACMYVLWEHEIWMHRSACMCTYMCASMWMPELNARYLPWSLSTWFLETDPFTEPGAHQLGLARELQGSSVLHLLSTRITCAYCHARHLTWVLGIQTQVFLLAWQALYKVSLLLPPIFCMWIRWNCN